MEKKKEKRGKVEKRREKTTKENKQFNMKCDSNLFSCLTQQNNFHMDNSNLQSRIYLEKGTKAS